VPKTKETIDAVTEWCGRAPERLDDGLRMLWEDTHPDVPFENEGAELLIRILKDVFADREINLRPVDILELTIITLIDAIPDVPVMASIAMASVAPSAENVLGAPPALRGLSVVSLSDQSIEKLASRIGELLAAACADKASPARRPKPKASSARTKTSAAKPTRTARKKARR
jgi:hypothetical protein